MIRPSWGLIAFAGSRKGPTEAGQTRNKTLRGFMDKLEELNGNDKTLMGSYRICG